MTALSQATVCVRTHQRDGISSSVLEALALGVPVVAADNPMRPSQVHTYQADDPQDLAAKVGDRCQGGVNVVYSQIDHPVGWDGRVAAAFVQSVRTRELAEIERADTELARSFSDVARMRFFAGSVAQAVTTLLDVSASELSDEELQDLQQRIDQARKEGR